MEMTGAGSSTELILHPFPLIGDSRLQVRYAILGLYKAGVTIAQDSQFHELDAALYMGEEEVGCIELQPKALNSGSLVLNSSYANGTTTLMADSGKVWDPDDGHFAITYSYDGVRVKAQDIFTAIIDSFAIAAEHDNTDADAYIPAARSASGDTVLSTWTVGEGGNAEMTWARLKKALTIIWDLLIIGRRGQRSRFEGLMFGLEYEGKGIGAGRMLRFNEDSKGGGGSAVER